MYISNICINNFRSIKWLSIETHKGLNVLIGANNSGKTSIIDALRICTGRENDYDKLKIKESDFYVDKETGNISTEILLSFIFNTEQEIELSSFLELVNLDNNQLQINFKFELISSEEDSYVKSTTWGGAVEDEGGRIPDEILIRFKSIYLSALRDAEQTLEGKRYSLIPRLMKNLEPDEIKQKEIVNYVHNDLAENEVWRNLVSRGSSTINTNFKRINFDDNKSEISLALLPFKFSSLTSQLHPQIPYLPHGTSEEKYFEISQNGLGENNLIYISTVLGNLFTDSIESSYKALLIEEPEAHLHPQQQNLLFEYFESEIDESTQVFITSHSPTITAKTELDKLIVIQNNRTSNSAINISNLDLDSKDKRHIKKFLDVTKAQLFFAKGVIFVEGISEAILVPTFAKKVLQTSDLIHKGIEIINVGGIAFTSFAKLFNGINHLTSKAVILSDDDHSIETSSVQQRVENIRLLANENLAVFLANETFEYELFFNNKEIVIEAYNLLGHSYQLNQQLTLEDQARNFVQTVKNSHSKADFAQSLSDLLEEQGKLENFVVPEYIRSGILNIIPH